MNPPQATKKPQPRPEARTNSTTVDPVASGRVPPQDLEAEMSLLGGMLLDRDIIGLALQIVPRERSDWFYGPRHGILFECLIDLYDQNQPIDIIVVESELKRRGIFDEIGGRDCLIDLYSSVPSSANVEYYAKIVREKGMLRDLIRATGQIMQTAYDDAEPAAEILDKAEQCLFKVTEQRVTSQPTSLREFLDETFRHLESEGDLLTGVPTGFTELDAKTGGLQKGDLVIVAARPSMGKTAFGLTMFEHVGLDENQGRGMPAVFFSLEMSKLQVVQRMLCSRARVDMHRMRHRTLSEEEMARLQHAAGELRDAPMLIDDTPGMSIMEVRAKARRLKMLHDIQVIFVDYLQLMTDPAYSRESRQQEISAISRGLKALGRDLGVPIVALAQLNRQVEARSSNRPRMSDLRESGAIEQDADVIMLLHREEYYVEKTAVEKLAELRGKAELIIDKQRNGPTGVVPLHFHQAITRFENATAGYVRDDGDYAASSYDPAAQDLGPYTPARDDDPAPF